MFETAPPPTRRRLGETSWADRLRGLAIALGAGLFLALAGAFGSSDTPFLRRLIYWVSMMVAGGQWGALVGDFVFRRGWFDGRLFAQGVIITVLIAGPLSVAVWVFTGLFFGRPISLAELPWYLMSVTVVSAAMTAVHLLADPGLRETHAAPEGAAPPRFLERLPFKLKGAEIYAVEAEDHYLRVHTDRGSDLILLRLSDAVTELEGIEGARTHRSWWVAKAAVAGVERGDGRAVFTLKNGLEVPVSRTHARVLREHGWY